MLALGPHALFPVWVNPDTVNINSYGLVHASIVQLSSFEVTSIHVNLWIQYSNTLMQLALTEWSSINYSNIPKFSNWALAGIFNRFINTLHAIDLIQFGMNTLTAIRKRKIEFTSKALYFRITEMSAERFQRSSNNITQLSLAIESKSPAIESHWWGILLLSCLITNNH